MTKFTFFMFTVHTSRNQIDIIFLRMKNEARKSMVWINHQSNIEERRRKMKKISKISDEIYTSFLHLKVRIQSHIREKFNRIFVSEFSNIFYVSHIICWSFGFIQAQERQHRLSPIFCYVPSRWCPWLLVSAGINFNLIEMSNLKDTKHKQLSN